MGSTLNAVASGQPERAPLPLPSREVVVEVRSLPDMPGAREVSARVDVAAPAEMVWRTLTDYERLAGAGCGVHATNRVVRVLTRGCVRLRRRHRAVAEREPHP